MAITLSYGYIQNETGDRGSVFFPDLEFNAQRVNDHNHNGVNSSLLSNNAINPQAHTLLAASWAAVAGQPGTFKQTVAVPSGVNLDRHLPRFKEPVSGNILNLSIVCLSITSYEVYINDSSLALQVVYV